MAHCRRRLACADHDNEPASARCLQVDDDVQRPLWRSFRVAAVQPGRPPATLLLQPGVCGPSAAMNNGERRQQLQKTVALCGSRPPRPPCAPPPSAPPLPVPLGPSAQTPALAVGVKSPTWRDNWALRGSRRRSAPAPGLPETRNGSPALPSLSLSPRCKRALA